MKDKVIVKNTLGGTFKKVFWKCIKLILASFFFVVFLTVLLSPVDSFVFVLSFIATMVLGGYLLFYVIKVLIGKTIAILSDEGIEVLDLAVIKWENISNIDIEPTRIGFLFGFIMLLTDSWGPGEYDFLTMITIKYIDSETGEEATVSFNTRTANFTHSQILEIIKKFQNKKK